MSQALNRGPIIRTQNSRKVPSRAAPPKTKEEQLMGILTDVMKTLLELNQSDKKKEVSNIYQRGGNINPDFDDATDRIDTQNRNQSGKDRVIRFSNQKTLQKSKYGDEYKLRLDPRDQLLAHPFTFEVAIPSRPQQYEEQKRTLFMNSQPFQQLCEHIEEYLVDVLQNIVSVSFNLLIENKLKENQSKDYASKNLLLNVQSIFREVMETLLREGLVDKKEERKLRYALTELVDSSLNQILSNLSPYYPQAPPTGGTPRMRQALISIDRNSNEQLDFLITQNLKLKKEDNGDYTEYIMQVINRAIQITGQIDPNDAYQLTMYQRFVAFSQNLFWISQEDSYSKVLNQAEKETANNHASKEINVYQVGKQRESSFKSQQEIQEVQQQLPPPRSYCNIFGNESLENRQKKNIELNNQETKDEVEMKDVKKKIVAYMKKPVFQEYSKANLVLVPDASKDKKIEQMRKRHDFAIGQKIPSSVKPFSKKDIKDKNFSAKNSTVLRILTKWAENLEGIFDNPENMTLNRIYPFKTLTHDLVFPTKDLKQQLYKQITDLKQKKQKMKEYLITRNKVFQSTFFSKQTKTNLTKYIKRYTETRVMASKMNALLIQFMKQYVSGLINLLVQAGKTSVQYTEGQFTITKDYEISLIIFKIGDLMRSKIHCNEASFIRLLKTMYILQQSDNNKKPLFELVRIKNKLDSQDNNILINYLFMGKLQCELQMSVQNIAGKEMHYYSFSHFLYELTRGQFGVLSQCATIVAQYDPIVSSSKSGLYYEPKKAKKRSRQKKIEEKIEIIDEKDEKDEKIGENKAVMKEEKKDNKVFVCHKCGNLKFDQNIDFLKREQGEKQFCNDCLLENITRDQQDGQQKMVESKLNNDERSAWLIENLNKQEIRKLKNYQIFDCEDQARIICHFNPKKNDIELSLYSHEMSQDVYFISRLSKQHWETEQINIQGVTYQNITQLIDKAKPADQFTYYFELNEKILTELLKKHKKIKIPLFIEKLRKIQTECKRQILLDSITTVFKNKNQTLLFNSNNTKLDLINHLIDEQMKNRKSTIRESFSHIQFVFAEDMNIEEVPLWLNMCNKMKVINFSNNKIKDISMFENMKDLKEVILRNNEIRPINWSRLHDLERLNLSDNKLDFFHMECLPQNLVQIDVGYNRLKFLNLDYLPRTLKKLDIFGNELVNLDLKQLHNGLQHLDISYNRLQSLKFTKFPSSLSVLYLNDNQLTHFQLHDQPNLVDFFISTNKLVSLSISNCPKLKQLHCDENQLTRIEFDDFPQVTDLNIGKNPLKSIILKNFPLLQTLMMGQISPNDDLQIKLENINTDTIKFDGSPEMLNYLKNNFTDLQFVESNDAVENNEEFEYNDSDDEDE